MCCGVLVLKEQCAACAIITLMSFPQICDYYPDVVPAGGASLRVNVDCTALETDLEAFRSAVDNGAIEDLVYADSVFAGMTCLCAVLKTPKADVFCLVPLCFSHRCRLSVGRP